MPGMNDTVKSQVRALCEQLKSAKAEMQPVTSEQIAAIVVRSILIETTSEYASDLIPALWSRVPESEQAETRKMNIETRQELIKMITPFITAASNNDKYFRKEGFLPQKPENAKPEFA